MGARQFWVIAAWRLVSLALVAALGPISCGPRVDVGAVTKFATRVDAAAKTIDNLASDLYDECQLRREYAGETRLGAPDFISTASELSSYPLEAAFPESPSGPKGAQPQPATTPSADLPKLTLISGDPKCVLAKDLAARWRLENDAVVLYVKKLGEIAGIDTAPDKAEYEKLGDSLHKAGVFSSDKVAEAAGDLMAGIGNVIIKGRRDAALVDVIEQAQLHGLPQILTQLRTVAAKQYYNQLTNTYSTVNSRFSLILSDEAARIRQLRIKNGELPDPIPQPSVTDLPDLAATPPAIKKCIFECALHTQLRAQIAVLRERTIQQRSRWKQVDDHIISTAGQIDPYYQLIYDIEQTNASLVKPTRPGLRGLVDAVSPWVSDLSAQVSALLSSKS